jgi:hypothetical protein
VFGKIEFYAESPICPPAAIEFEPGPCIVNERKTPAFIAAYRPIPTLFRIRNTIREPPCPEKGFISDPNDIKVKVVTGVAHVPHKIPASFARAIRFRRERIIGISKPPERVQLLRITEIVRGPWVVGNYGDGQVGGGTDGRRLCTFALRGGRRK